MVAEGETPIVDPRPRRLRRRSGAPRWLASAPTSWEPPSCVLVALSLGLQRLSAAARACCPAGTARRRGWSRSIVARRPADLDLASCSAPSACSTPGALSASAPVAAARSAGGRRCGVPRGAEARTRRRRGGCRADGPAGRAAWRWLIMVAVIAVVVRALGDDDEARARLGDLQLRLALVPHAVRGRTWCRATR